MNANELADELEDDYWDSRAKKVMLESAKMLRQQQAEIEALKAELRLIDELVAGKDESFDRTASHMAGDYVSYNEPVAWINLDRFKDEALYLADCVSENEVENMGITTPLYTHTAKTEDEQFKKGFEAGKEEGWKAYKFHHPAKTLTDEEIDAVGDEVSNLIDTYAGRREFAKAILRKAQEK